MKNNNASGPASAASAASVLANRTNAAKSTGPTTILGKATSSMNAVKTGLTGRTVLLPSDNAAEYTRHMEGWQAELRPLGPRECSLVQSIADAHWRTERIARLEFALWAQGNELFAEQFGSECDAELRRGLIEMQTMLHFDKQLRNLHLQESRIRRAREKDMKELKDLQAKRRAEAEERAYQAAMAAQRSKHSQPAAGSPNGFVFSNVSAAPNSPSHSCASAAATSPGNNLTAPKTAA